MISFTSDRASVPLFAPPAPQAYLLKNTSSFDGKESFQDLKDNLSKYACGAGGANNGTEALSEVKEIILII